MKAKILLKAKMLSASLALTAAFFTTACGFHPLYGSAANGQGPSQILSNIYVEPISDRIGYQIRNDLLDLFNATGSPDNAAYRLKLSLTESEEGVVLQPDTAITRYDYMLTAHYDLIQKGTTTVVKHGDVGSLTDYNVASAPFLYATVSAQRDAHDRAANEIAERIRTQLAVYLRGLSNTMPNAQP